MCDFRNVTTLTCGRLLAWTSDAEVDMVQQLGPYPLSLLLSHGVLIPAELYKCFVEYSQIIPNWCVFHIL